MAANAVDKSFAKNDIGVSQEESGNLPKKRKVDVLC
jgi:hypothetical protein